MAHSLIPVIQRRRGVLHCSVFLLDLSVNGEVLQSLSEFQYAAAVPDWLEIWRCDSGVRNDGYDFFMNSQCHSVLTAVGAWL